MARPFVLIHNLEWGNRHPYTPLGSESAPTPTFRLTHPRQLELPVVLHTKGMESEIARTLRRYTLPKLVHWYSCEDYLFDYLDQDCYFTIGPDHETNPDVQAVLRHVPLNRILTETDGLDAVAWALNRPVEPTEINRLLRGELAAIASVHGIDPAVAEATVEANYERFLHGSCI